MFFSVVSSGSGKIDKVFDTNETDGSAVLAVGKFWHADGFDRSFHFSLKNKVKLLVGI